MKTVSRLKIKMLYTHVGSKGHYASASVSAHHASRTIRIEIHHTEIVSIAVLQKHKSVSPDTVASVTDIRYLHLHGLSFRIPERKDTGILCYRAPVDLAGVF